jgi:hypothetical protein
LIIQLIKLNNLLTLVGITIFSLLSANPFFLQTQIPYEKETNGQGYDVIEIKDSEEATEEEEEAIEEAKEDED